MNFFVIHLVESLVYPPGGPILLLLFGIIFSKKRTIYFLFVFLAIVILYFSSIPFTNAKLSSWIETKEPLSNSSLKTAGAIVVLGFGRYHSAPEYGEKDTSSSDETSRLRYAAFLYERNKLPIAVVGGDRLKTGTTGADIMADVLENEFHVPVRYRDGRSLHTFDNAKYAHEILSKDGINRIALVTHSWHMHRAELAFEKEGFSVIAAPTQFFVPGPLDKGFGAWIPTAHAMELNNWILHEIFGIIWLKIFN